MRYHETLKLDAAPFETRLPRRELTQGPRAGGPSPKRSADNRGAARAGAALAARPGQSRAISLNASDAAAPSAKSSRSSWPKWRQRAVR